MNTIVGSSRDCAVGMFGKSVINIPDLFYCGSCKSVYLYRRNIINHFCKGGKKEASREGKITELFEDWNLEEHLASGKRKITELRENCNLVKFLTWFLPQVLATTILNIFAMTLDDHLDSNEPFPEDGVSSKMVNELVLISAEDAEKILSSTCKFSVKDAGMFLSKFPESEACRLNPKRLLEYHRVKNIWNLFGPKPVTECWDLVFSKSIVGRCGVMDLYYPELEMLCHTVGRPLVPYPVFELYSIVINKLCSKRDFSLIYMSNRATCKHALTIYRVSKGEKAELHESLSLKGPFRLPTPFCDVSISFTDSNTAKDEWRFDL